MGKRPDQHNIDPAEAGATDYKNLPQTGRGHSSADDTAELDRQRVEQSRKEAEGQPRLGDRPAPTRDVKHGTKLGEAGEAGSKAKGDGDGGDADAEGSA